MANSATAKSSTLSFDPGQDMSFGEGVSHFRHGFTESGLFTDEKLAELIDCYPREYYMITTVTGDGKNSEWLNGDFNGASGQFILDAIREGHLWLCLRRLDLVAPEIDAMVNGAFEDIEARNPKLKTSRRRSSLLISSPSARVLYHSDIPMVVLWHVRGRKRIWLYDADNPNHLPDETLEGIVLRETEEEIFYDPAWDVEAQTIDLEPGWALSWPQNAPHRVDNLDDINVSITTDFYTPSSQRKYGVYFTNGLLRRRLGWEPRSTSPQGAAALMKCMAAVSMKKLGLHHHAEREMMQSFVLDLKRPGAINELPESEWSPILQT